MSTTPDISLRFSQVDFHTPFKMEIDGRTMDNKRIEKVFSENHRALRTTPISSSTVQSDSSWDSEPDAEVVGTIHTSDEPWFNVDDLYVVHERAMDEALKKFEEVCDQDTPLKFRRFMEGAVRKLRKSLEDCLEYEFLLTDVDAGAARHPEFDRWAQDVVFPVKRPRSAGYRPSDSTEF